MNRVLVVDSDLSTCKEIKYNLQDDTTTVFYTQSIKEALHMMQEEAHSLIIIDACLSQNGGMEIIQQIRLMNPLPILALSETASTADKVAALQCGADDFMNKPYDLDECLARAQALMRRHTRLNHISGRSYALVSHGDLLLDTGRQMASVAGKEVRLTKTEYTFLLYFLKNRNRVLTFEQIYNAVWHEEYYTNNATIFYHVGNLRKKISADWIESRYGIGYFIHNPGKV